MYEYKGMKEKHVLKLCFYEDGERKQNIDMRSWL